jgi:hypothetical protein
MSVKIKYEMPIIYYMPAKDNILFKFYILQRRPVSIKLILLNYGLLYVQEHGFHHSMSIEINILFSTKFYLHEFLEVISIDEVVSIFTCSKLNNLHCIEFIVRI